ncbi:MAG: hypothetical protein J6N49_03170 [Alphaproteobacteria bacterium]|nr:hypothetical protein [Alphaproteobacteria bacterium]
MYENWKILKSEADEKAEEYSQVAEWCNEGQEYHIEDDGTYYKVVKNPEPTEEDIKQARINELKQLLADTDYVVIKIAEGSATKEDYADVIEQRKAWREEIRVSEDG